VGCGQPGQLLAVALGVLLLIAAMYLWTRANRKHANARRHGGTGHAAGSRRKPRTA
jgi:uncharacterized membrane protein YfcA